MGMENPLGKGRSWEAAAAFGLQLRKDLSLLERTSNSLGRVFSGPSFDELKVN